MADPDRKTTATDADVEAYLAEVTDPRRQADAREAVALVAEVTGAEPVMWGPSIIGFGRQTYTTSDSKQHEMFAVGVAPRKAALTFYGLTYYGSNTDLLERLGPHTTGKGCLYVKRLADVDHDVLVEMVGRAWTTNHAGD